MASPPASKRGARFPLPMDQLVAANKVGMAPVTRPQPASSARAAGAAVPPSATRSSVEPNRRPAGLAVPAPKLTTTATASATAQALLRPQRLLQDAARDARRPHAPHGLGLDSQALRARMVQRLRIQGLCGEAVAQAMREVERHHFVDSALAAQAYEDTSLPIGLGQTISKPSVVARMIELLMDGTAARLSGSLGATLEIGGGCGYQTAILARLATRVVAIERLKPLHDKARQQLRAHLPQGGARVQLMHGDGRLGHAAGGPYQSLIAAAGGDDLPQAWLDQLAVGGRLVAPWQAGPGRGQVLVVVDRHAQGWQRQEHEGVHFVPLNSGIA